MSDIFLWHRKFLPYTSPKFYHMPSLDQIYDEQHSYTAYTFTSSGLKPTRIALKQNQFFILAATPFERLFSILCGGDGFEPVVDDDLSVAGHIGQVQDGFGNIFVPKGRQMMPLGSIVDGDLPVIIAGSNPDTSATEEHNEGRLLVYKVLTDPNGKVLFVLSQHSADGLAPPAIDPFMLFSVGKLAFGLIKGIGSALIRKAATALVVKALSKTTGSMTAKEMELLVKNLISRRPELAALQAASRLEGEALQKEVMAALRKWESSTGKSVKFVKLGEVQKLTGAPGNYASLQGNTLMIEEHVVTDSQALFREVTHELSADALSVRGQSIGADQLAFIGQVFLRPNSSLSMLEMALRNPGQFRRAIDSFR